MMRNSLIAAGFVGMVALCMAGAAVAAPPPHTPPPTIHLGLQFGTPNYDYGDDCVSSREIYFELRHQGYSFLHLVSDDGDTLTYVTRLGDRDYVLTVDSCSGEVLDRHRAFHHDDQNDSFYLGGD